MRIKQTETEGFDGHIVQMQVGTWKVIFGIRDHNRTITWFSNLPDAVLYGLADWEWEYNSYKRNCPGKDNAEKIMTLLATQLDAICRDPKAFTKQPPSTLSMLSQRREGK